MATIDAIKDSLIGWAVDNGICQNNVVPPESDKSLVPFSNQCIDFFRTRKIVRINVVNNQNLITIFTRLVLAKTKVRKLIEEFENKYLSLGFKLKVDVSKPFKVDQRLNNFGKLDPIHKVNNRFACGSSIGIGNQRNAGTLTALGMLDGQMVGISCNHVIGGCNTTRPGTPIVIPGIQDVHTEVNEIKVVGYHSTTAIMSQGLPSMIDITKNCDLAIFEIKNPNIMTSYQGKGNGKYDTPTQFAKVKHQLSVKKWGRSTGLTTGYISNIIRDGNESVDYNVISYFDPVSSQVFKGTIYFDTIYEVTSATGFPFSLGGDSGSLVVSNEGNGTNRIVGIVIGGSKEKSIVLPIEKALIQLGVKVVNSHNCIS